MLRRIFSVPAVALAGLAVAGGAYADTAPVSSGWQKFWQQNLLHAV